MADRRAEDLWVVGKEMALNDGKGPVTLYMRKMTPVDNEAALRRANATRARVRALLHDRDCDDAWDLRSQVEDIESREDLIEYLIMRQRLHVEERVEAELAAEDEWADGYIQGLRDTWKGSPDEEGLEAVHLLDPDDVEASRVWSELQRFAGMAGERGAPEVQALRDALDALSTEDLRERAFDQIVRFEAENAWLSEFMRCQLFYGARRADDHNARYFKTRGQFDNLSAEALVALRNVYNELEVGPAEGKGSEETPTSSTSSESPSASATGVSSGLVVVAP